MDDVSENTLSGATYQRPRAQVVAYYFPKLVELHNYTAANAVEQKIYNWNTLNEKVQTRLQLLVLRIRTVSVVAKSCV